MQQMDLAPRRVRGMTGLAGLVASLALASTVAAQQPARVAVLPVALYTAGANVAEASDSLAPMVADSVLRAKLNDLAPGAGLFGDSVRSAAGGPAAMAAASKQPCNVIVGCARAVGHQLGTPWAVMAKVSKTSNLIWIFSGQLINVETGKLELDDTTELKGDPVAMTRAGVGIFAERVARVLLGKVAASR